MVLWAFPAIAWAEKDTVFSVWDFAITISLPFLSTIIAAGCAVAVRLLYGRLLPTFPRLVLEVGVWLAIYGGLTWFVSGQKSLYIDLFRGLKGTRPQTEERALIPTAA
jgi:hypothetical protein